jgi:hypothetical protein
MSRRHPPCAVTRLYTDRNTLTMAQSMKLDLAQVDGEIGEGRVGGARQVTPKTGRRGNVQLAGQRDQGQAVDGSLVQHAVGH